jgi:hypothetical protein
MTKKQLPRGLRNCNPGNIRKNNTLYVGEIVPSKDDEFKQFVTMAYGYRAMFVLLYTYQHRYGLDTAAKMITRYAPENENHTEAYIEAVAERSGVSAHGRITATNGDVMIPIVVAMSAVENGVEAKMHDVEEGWKLFIYDFRNKLL